MIGTPRYMAPELFSGGRATAVSDLYSLGVLLFRLVTGGYPVDGESMTEVQAAHERQERRRLRDVRPGLPPSFVQVVERALAPDPRERIESAGALEAALADAILPDVAGVSDDPARVTIGRWLRGRPWLVAAFVIAAGAATWTWWPGRPVSPPVSGAGPVRTIAVKPLKNLTGDANQDYFAAGLSDVLVAQLGGIRALRVVALADSGPAADPATYPGVQAILEASVQRAEGRIWLSARLVPVAGGALLWGRTYDGTDGEVLSLQGRIAADVAKDLKVSVSDTESRRLSRTYHVSREAQNAYLRGRYLLDSLTRTNLQQARVEFEEAVRLEPEYAPAHASLAMTYMALGALGVLRPDEMRALATPAATTAFRLDPALAEAALAIADVRFRMDWDWAGADDAYRTAIDLNPSFVDARARYARYLAAAGRISDALREARAAAEIDPVSADIHNVVGLMLYYDGQHDAAIAHFRSRLNDRTARGHVVLARSYAAAGRYVEAIDSLEFAYNASNEDPALRAELARTMADAGDTAGARRILAELYARRRARHDYIAPQDLAYIHTALGERDQAFALLAEAIDERAARLLWLAVDPRVNPLRSDWRFRALLARLGLDVQRSQQEVSR
jgi:serine/threonine-protein kinase